MAQDLKEIEQIKARLRKAEQRENEEAAGAVRLKAYKRKAERKMRKNRSKAAKRDVFAKGQRLPGSGFSK